MKNFKRFTAAIAATLMAATLSVPMATSFTTSAADITMENGTETNATSTFEAYKILDASIAGDAYTYTVNETYRDILKAALELETSATDDDIITKMNSLTAETLRPVADKIYKAILNDNVSETATSVDGVFTGLAQGYYLIAETALGTSDTAGTMSLVMVDTMGEDNVEVKTKKEAPSFQKKVKDTNDSTGATTDWQDSADYDIGDDVPFQLKATLPADYDKYAQYKLVFHDDLNKADGKDVFEKPTSVSVWVDKDKDGVLGDGEALADEQYTFASAGITEHDEFDCDFEVTIANLKAIEGITYDMPVYVEYTAKLNSDAVIGSVGNWNDAYLEYSNNPYHTGEGDTTSKTVVDTNVVFTYKTVINKVKAGASEDTHEALTGAKFKLEKKVNGASNVTIKEFTTGDESTFEFTGLDDGDYILTETDAPVGYKKIDPIEFTITADHTNDPNELKLTALTGNVTSGEINVIDLDVNKNMASNLTEGSLTASVLNTSGSELPSTGGMGTTLFYIGGGAMAAVAGIFLITKKRMNKDAE